MPDIERRSRATDKAETYAPRPQGSWLTYGAIAVVVLALLLWALDQFYSLDLLDYPITIGTSFAGVFVGGVILRRSRKRQHSTAVEVEYASDRGQRVNVAAD